MKLICQTSTSVLSLLPDLSTSIGISSYRRLSCAPFLKPLIPRCSSDYGQIPAAGNNVFSDEKEEVQVSSAFHAGRAHSSAFCQRSSFLQDPASGWWGLCHHVIQVGHFLFPHVKSLLRAHLCLMPRFDTHSAAACTDTLFSLSD